MSDSEIEKEWAEVKEDQEKFDAENKKFVQMEYERALKAGGVMKALAEASKMAKSGMESDGLMPTKGKYGEWTYTTDQGAKAASYAREDAATTLILQAVLQAHLRGIKKLLLVCVCLLAYIAYKLH